MTAIAILIATRRVVLGRAARLPPKVVAIPAHAIFEREEPTGAALDDTGLCEVVYDLRRHPKAAR